VIVHYWLKDEPKGDITLTFLDGEGKELRAFSSRKPAKPPVPSLGGASEAISGEEARPEEEVSAQAGEDEPRLTKTGGGNRFVWNLHVANATKLPDNKGRGGTIDALTGPRIPPGRYQVRLKVGEQTLTQPLEIARDPRVATTDEELREQYAWAKKTHDMLTRVHDAVLRLRDARAQAEAWAKRSDQATVKDASKSLCAKLSAIEGELIQVRSDDPRMFPAKLNTRLATVAPLIEYSDAMPTASLRDLADNLMLRAEMELAKLDRCLADDVAAFNTCCRDAGLAAVVPKP
jgi:hypothetical protein